MYRKWKRIAGKYIQRKQYDEIKSSSMDYEEKKEVLLLLHEKHVDFKVWYGVINTDSGYYIRKFIHGDIRKELAFNYTLNKLFRNEITKTVSSETVRMYIDNRNIKTESSHTLEGYINLALMDTVDHPCEKVRVQYMNSKHCYGIQLADLVANIIFIHLEYGRCAGIFRRYIQPRVCGTHTYPKRN